MRKKIKLLLAFALCICVLFAGCQTAEMKEITKKTDQEANQETGNSKDKNAQAKKTDEEAYIDADYVDKNYGDEDEDLEKYQSEKEPSADNAKSEKNTQVAPGQSESAASQSNGAQSESTAGDPAGNSALGQDQYQTNPVPEGMPRPVEPQDVTVDSSQSFTCSLYVECSTILNNMDNLAEGKKSLIPPDGVIYGPSTVTFYEGESVYDVLLREMQNNRIHMESEFTAANNSAYIKAINNLYERDCGELSGWRYCVNGWYPNYGCSRYQIQNGDTVELHYTCDLGRDLGADVPEGN